LKKDITEKRKPRREEKTSKQTTQRRGRITIGMDLGDKTSRYCVLDESGEVIAERSTATTKNGMLRAFASVKHCRLALEVGTHSPWVSRLLTKLGHEVIVANARQVKLISASSRKDDRLDARMLARLARADPKLLAPVRHRSEEAQADMNLIRVREALVEGRTRLVNSARGLAKTAGERLPACDPDQLRAERMAELPPGLQEVLKPLFEMVETLTGKIKECDRKLEQIAREKYPETKLLQQVKGVGTLIALTFVLTVEDKTRFAKSRDVGCYLGLRPKRSESGQRQPELRITKEGDRYLRKLLVQGAHCLLSQRGPDTDLKRWGLQLSGRGGKNARKRAIVAVARKLAVLLHHLWVTGEVYEPLRNATGTRHLKQAAA